VPKNIDLFKHFYVFAQVSPRIIALGQGHKLKIACS